MDSKSDYREVYISKEDFDKLRLDRSFVKLLVLARVVNALYFCFSALLDYKNDLTPAGQRQFYNAFLFSSGALYEGLIVADTLENHFGDRDSYRKGFGKLLKHAKTKEIRSTILERMRNSCVFHFSEGVARKTIKTLDLQRQSRCISPTSRNQHILRPWAALISARALQVILFKDT